MFQKVFEYAGPHKKGLYAATAIVLVSVLMGVLPFVLAYQVIAPLVMGESIGASFIISRVALVLACLVLQALFYGWGLNLSHKAAYDTLLRLRTALQKRFEKLPLGVIQDKGTGTVKKLFVDDVDSLEVLLAHSMPEGIANLMIPMGKPDATEEEVYEAARKARCYDFIMALPDGFQTVVGEGGATLSGGEKQRISIARCILKDAPIVILDEATASVDTDNESYIQEAISELVKGKTLLVIAHRLNTIQTADQILVIDNGQIAQQGNHEELLKQPGIYQDFVNIRKSAAGWSLA